MAVLLVDQARSEQLISILAAVVVVVVAKTAAMKPT
jgi:hypothetical protein